MMIVIHIITINVIRIRAIMCCICAAIICFKLAFKSASFGGELSWASNDLSDRYLHTGPLSGQENLGKCGGKGDLRVCTQANDI